MKRLQIKKVDIVLFLAVICIGITALLLLLTQTHKGAEVVVTVQGRIYGTYELSSNQQIRIENENKEYNLLVIQDGFAYVSEADCKNQICVHQRKISKTGESIICLPHQVEITIMDAEQAETDAIAK